MAKRITKKTGKKLTYDELRKKVNRLETELSTARASKQQDDALDQSEDKHRFLIENMKDALVMFDEKGILTYVNGSFCDMYGFPKEEIVGKAFFDFHDADDMDALEKELIKSRRADAQSFDLDGIKSDGSRLLVHATLIPFRDLKGNNCGYFCTVSDVSKRKRMEDEIKVKTQRLEEVNTALKILLKKSEEDKAEIEEKMLYSIKELLSPYIDKIKKCKIDKNAKSYLKILESNLNDFILPFSNTMGNHRSKLTHTEIQVANLVKHGKTTKEISDMLRMSSRTIDTHRYNIRKKLKINNAKVSLRSYLSNLS